MVLAFTRCPLEIAAFEFCVFGEPSVSPDKDLAGFDKRLNRTATCNGQVVNARVSPLSMSSSLVTSTRSSFHRGCAESTWVPYCALPRCTIANSLVWDGWQSKTQGIDRFVLGSSANLPFVSPPHFLTVTIGIIGLGLDLWHGRGCEDKRKSFQ